MQEGDTVKKVKTRQRTVKPGHSFLIKNERFFNIIISNRLKIWDAGVEKNLISTET
jgi:hypothetical protein